MLKYTNLSEVPYVLFKVNKGIELPNKLDFIQ